MAYMLHDLSSYIVARLLLAAVLGGLVGLERELSHKPAGIRTNMLICLGAALFTIISYETASNVGGDHTRIAAQIIPGIGFIGAGVVIRERGAIIGITSAATLFVVASVGMAVGAGLYITGIFTMLLLLSSLVIIGNIEQRVGLHTRVMNFRIIAPPESDPLARVHSIVEEMGLHARRWHSYKLEEGLLVEFEAEMTLPQERDLMTRLAPLKGRLEAHPVSPVTPL
jgi:putative Mg2+ transporter-C (MgtC) family protein